jgi:SAM-dependent methyltransferase
VKRFRTLYHELVGVWLKKFANLIASAYTYRQYGAAVEGVRIGRPRTILDVGGSSGSLARKILAQIGDCEYYILEIDAESVNEGKRRNPRMHYALADVEACPFGDEAFDLVICKDVLHHCSDPRRAVTEIRRVGRRFIIIEARRGDKWLDAYLPSHPHFTVEQFSVLVKPASLAFLDLCWPSLRWMALFVLSPVLPRSPRAFMVGYSDQEGAEES